MFKCVVEMYGLPYELTSLREVEVELEDGARLGDVVAELRNKAPALEGQVIRSGEKRLVDSYRFNVNGHFHFDDMDFRINNGDRIALLTPAIGG